MTRVLNPRNEAPTLADFWSLRFAAAGHPLTQLVSQRLGAVLAWLAARAHLSPSEVTLLGFVTFLLGAGLYATLGPGLGAALLCAAVLQLGYGFDCADGQLARATGRTSTFGASLDVACDYARTAVLAAGCATWLAERGVPAALAGTCGSLFFLGSVVQVWTATRLRGRPEARPLQGTPSRERLRRIATWVLDTATVLLLVGALRDWSLLLAAYLAGMGLVYMAASAYLTHQRLA